jgi:hypothetical protein
VRGDSGTHVAGDAAVERTVGASREIDEPGHGSTPGCFDE